MKTIVKLVTLLAFTLALPHLARAQAPAVMEQAKKEYDAGQTAYDLAHYEEALNHFTKAYELSKLPAILYNLGQAHRRLYETGGALDNLRRAREMYRSYLRLVPFSSDRALCESLLKGVEEEYSKQLHAQRDKLLIEARGVNALNLAEDFVSQGDLDAAETALQRFASAPGNKRIDVARAARVKGRAQAAHGKTAAAADSFARALELDSSTAPPPDLEKPALAAFGKAQARMKGKPQLGLAHVPPARIKIGASPKLRIEVTGDTLALVSGLKLSYRAGGGAFASMNAQPGDVTFPPTFNAGLAPGAHVEYYVTALDEDGAVLDTLGSPTLPFSLNVDAKPAVAIYKRWQFWVGLGAGVVAAAGVAAAVGVTQSPPERVVIPVNTGLWAR